MNTRWSARRRSTKSERPAVAILIVNGFDRHSKDPFEVDEALTYPWIDLCLRQVQRHSQNPAEILVWDNSYLPEHRAIMAQYDNVTVYDDPGKVDVRHGAALDRLVGLVPETAEWVITLDTDAFPIRDRWIEELVDPLVGGAALVGVWRDEMQAQITPYVHPSCLAARRKTLVDLGIPFKRASGQDVGQNISLALAGEGRSFGRLTRTNVRNPHFLMAGIYGDLIYHHGAGSRKAGFWTSDEQMADERARVLLRDAVFGDCDGLVRYLLGAIDDDTAVAGGLADVVRLNSGDDEKI
jgi:hypothetical protein